MEFLVGKLAEAGYVVALDEFQYFSRKILYEFTSHLQATVDGLSSRAGEIPGGLFVLGSIPAIEDDEEREAIEARGYLPQDLSDLTQGL